MTEKHPNPLWVLAYALIFFVGVVMVVASFAVDVDAAGSMLSGGAAIWGGWHWMTEEIRRGR